MKSNWRDRPRWGLPWTRISALASFHSLYNIQSNPLKSIKTNHAFLPLKSVFLLPISPRIKFYHDLEMFRDQALAVFVAHLLPLALHWDSWGPSTGKPLRDHSLAVLVDQTFFTQPPHTHHSVTCPPVKWLLRRDLK